MHNSSAGVSVEMSQIAAEFRDNEIAGNACS
jgi:hypothetical protein